MLFNKRNNRLYKRPEWIPVQSVWVDRSAWIDTRWFLLSSLVWKHAHVRQKLLLNEFAYIGFNLLCYSVLVRDDVDSVNMGATWLVNGSLQCMAKPSKQPASAIHHSREYRQVPLRF